MCIRYNTSSVKTQLFVLFGRKAIISIFAHGYKKPCVFNQKAFMCFGTEECEVMLLSWALFLSPPALERGCKMMLIAVLYLLCVGQMLVKCILSRLCLAPVQHPRLSGAHPVPRSNQLPFLASLMSGREDAWPQMYSHVSFIWEVGGRQEAEGGTRKSKLMCRSNPKVFVMV